ncbi:MAG: malonyl-CoA decarboxylase [Acidimicrobiaceae bacterium]|nr:malonyl-CoA decarboxylase [Acidimicrobiaceae bacterium]MBO0747318.1 malonyl-CoA decarboxylase [Acidimicrobiaceae bacterium]
MTERAGRGQGTALDALCLTAEALLANTSETASLALAELVVRRYGELKKVERREFMMFLLHRLGPSRPALDVAIDRYRQDGSEASLTQLFQAAEPRRQALFRSINSAPGGTWTVLSMRADILDFLDECPELEPVEADLFHVLSSWFNRGFIALQRINWESPGAVLERLIAYEAVHEIRGWDDLRRRLEADRRCFGYFHPAIPAEPLIFIEVALTHGLAESIQAVLDAPVRPLNSEPLVDTATFYSITSCQAGLRGIQLGSFLIQQVVHELSAELPSLRLFATLSPVPGFARWLGKARGRGLFTSAEKATLRLLDDPFWYESGSSRKELEPLLLRACAHYLVHVKRGVHPMDSVARFHLRNGARLERINWLADLSPKGFGESHGILVNYVYDESQVADNHEGYVHEGRVAHSDAVAGLLTDTSRV